MAHWRTTDDMNLLRKPVQLEPAFTAKVVVKGEEVAVLHGRDAEALRQRAFNFANAQGWHRPAVVIEGGNDAA